MIIEEKFLYSAGAELIQYRSGDMIFQEGEILVYYHQLIQGKLKLCCHSKGGTLYQSSVSEGQSFGDALLFFDKPYPVTAFAVEACDVIRLCKYNFFSMLEVYPQLYNGLCKELARHCYKQYERAEMDSENSAQRFMKLFDCL
ncbi:Crp/Fnr family transcriptional regulator [Chryseobacterium wangxinyae]|uniref:Crp/Fnr family transcriptional regulator n=1 Tax=Chryseobacterium sp. CY350 TaxID=2997336 RepID=UPI00226DE792|nr:Crp/Fnr family transcriptional regulator [Chryseobacterium sp. CY350]MCY0976906.1 Crp/Fnr family transcriptional regulator [Chryseobacterium sp. CY350]WBZ96905.1 Crp/Fnr family transcriptional regulator [Chryseobacterium sp. CY350]